MAPFFFFNFFTKESTAFSAHFSSSSPCFQPSSLFTAGLVKENKELIGVLECIRSRDHTPVSTEARITLPPCKACRVFTVLRWTLPSKRGFCSLRCWSRAVQQGGSQNFPNIKKLPMKPGITTQHRVKLHTLLSLFLQQHILKDK